MCLSKFIHFLLPILVVCGVTLLSSCSIIPEGNYTALAEQERQLSTAWPEQKGAQETTSLRELISAPQLNELIDEALQANPSLQQTILTLQILRAQRRQTTADRLPNAEFVASAEKEDEEDESFSGTFTISWEADLWQKLADSESAAQMDEAEQLALLQAGRASLTAEVMQEWLGLIGDKHTINIEQLRLANLEKNELYILQRYRSGIGSLEDLDSARSSTSVSRASLEEYEESLAQRQRTLKTILGRVGTAERNADIVVTESYPSVIIPLADLPDQTLKQRPDLQAAYFAIEADDLRTSVAYKDLLPSISLEAALEDIGDSPQSMLLSDPVWALLGQLTAPIFQGGKLRSAAEIAELETAQSYEAYREALLEAIGEVENGLSLERSISRRQEYITAALASARNSLARYEESYRAGLVDILDLLVVQEKTFDLASQRDNLIYERLVNRIDLGLALGLGVEK
ncbi:MAG: outer membrane protein TolC [Desulforhopalus sp.]|jgi:outer membrane protein TolC